MKKLITSLAVCWLCFASLAQAQAITGDELARAVRRHVDYQIAADGTGTVTVDFALSPLKREGINGLGQQSISYQESMSTLEILSAYTLKSDGRRIDVPADRIIVQVPAAYANAPIFTDMKVKHIVFPDLEVGDQVVYRYKRTWQQPLFPGRFFDSELFPASRRYDDVRITATYPKASAPQFQVRGLDEQPAKDADGFVTREWKYRSTTLIPDEVGAVSAYDRDPLFIVSTFKSWADVASAYDARARDKAAITPTVKKLANEITGKIRGKRDQAQAIYAWVTQNIRYVAVYLGAGGYVPHTADSILANRYGDCKDYTTLMGALLDAKGIANEPVIIDAVNRFSLPDVPTPDAFNHAIVYLPEFKIYLDPTARTLPFGSLAPLEANKFVLHTRYFKDLVRTPKLLASDRAMLSQGTAVVGDDGSLKGSSTLSAKGLMGAELSALLDRFNSPQVAKQMAAGMLSLHGFTGTADIARENSLAPQMGPAYKAEFQITNWINLPGPGATRLPSGLFSMNQLQQMSTTMLNAPKQRVDRICFPGVFEEHSTMQMPAAMKLNNLPKAVGAENAFAKYQSSYSLATNNTITVSRRLELKFESTVCSADDMVVFREIAEQMRRDTAAQLTYE